MLLTKALAEIKLVTSKIEKAQEEIERYVVRRGDMFDPLENSGGSTEFVIARLQSTRDLFDNLIELRRRIRTANEAAFLTVEGVQRTVSDWLTWKREIATPQIHLYEHILNHTEIARRTAAARATKDAPQPVVLHLNEKALLDETVKLKTILGKLDGELSVFNATIEV
jgi:hypothetical protein